MLEIEFADQQADLGGDLATVLGEHLQFVFHHVGCRADVADGRRQAFSQAAYSGIRGGGDAPGCGFERRQAVDDGVGRIIELA